MDLLDGFPILAVHNALIPATRASSWQQSALTVSESHRAMWLIGYLRFNVIGAYVPRGHNPFKLPTLPALAP